MSVDIRTVRLAIATAVGAILGLNTSYFVPDQVNTPLAVVFRKLITYDVTMGGAGTDRGNSYLFAVVVYAPRAAAQASQDLLDNYCEPTGATSIKAAIETNAALQALVAWADVTSASEPQIATAGQIEYMTTEWTVEVSI